MCTTNNLGRAAAVFTNHDRVRLILDEIRSGSERAYRVSLTLTLTATSCSRQVPLAEALAFQLASPKKQVT
jgi:hypothetical protein